MVSLVQYPVLSTHRILRGVRALRAGHRLLATVMHEHGLLALGGMYGVGRFCCNFDSGPETGAATAPEGFDNSAKLAAGGQGSYKRGS